MVLFFHYPLIIIHIICYIFMNRFQYIYIYTFDKYYFLLKLYKNCIEVFYIFIFIIVKVLKFW